MALNAPEFGRAPTTFFPHLAVRACAGVCCPGIGFHPTALRFRRGQRPGASL